jgi:hypothetical protein
VNICLNAEQHSKTIVYGATKGGVASYILVCYFCYNCYFWRVFDFCSVFSLFRVRVTVESDIVVRLRCILLTINRVCWQKFILLALGLLNGVERI